MCLKRPRVNRTRAAVLIYVAVTRDGRSAGRPCRQIVRTLRSRAWIFLPDVSRSRNWNKGVLKYESTAIKRLLFRIGPDGERGAGKGRGGGRHSSCYLTSRHRHLINVPLRRVRRSLPRQAGKESARCYISVDYRCTLRAKDLSA